MIRFLTFLLFPVLALCQDATHPKWTPFSFTPVGQDTYRVNGLALGAGLAFPYKDNEEVTVNGLNIETNPLSLFYFIFMDPGRINRDSIFTRINGLHISTGGLMGNVRLNGLGIALFNVGSVSNGVSISGLYNVNRVMNGLHIAIWGNNARDKANGLLIGVANGGGKINGAMLGCFNKSADLNGFSVGLTNRAEGQMTGLQIGIFNRAKQCKGLQIGLWNVNEKRSLPFVNW